MLDTYHFIYIDHFYIYGIKNLPQSQDENVDTKEHRDHNKEMTICYSLKLYSFNS